MLPLLSAQLQIPLHIAQHQHHLHRKSDLLPEVDAVHPHQNLAHLRGQHQHQPGSAQAGEALAHLVQKMGVEIEEIAEIGGEEEGEHDEEGSVGVDGLVGDVETQGRQEEKSRVQFGRSSLHDKNQSYISFPLPRGPLPTLKIDSSWLPRTDACLPFLLILWVVIDGLLECLFLA